MLTVDLSYVTVIMLMYVPSMPTFWGNFDHKLVLNFVKNFFCDYCNNHMIFILQLVNVYYIDFSDIEKSLTSLG